MANFNRVVEQILNFEGGFQNSPSDRANYTSSGKLVGTNRGISAIAYQDYLRREPTVEDIKAITPEIAKDVYKRLFWDPMIKGDSIKDESVALLMFDSIIATGNTREIRDGINKVAPGRVVKGTANFTSYTIDVVNSLPQKRLFDAIWEENVMQRKHVATNEGPNDPQAQFLKGWLNRLNSITYKQAAIGGAGFFLSFSWAFGG